ncbi:MAG: hypothetical protein EOO71_04545 [Myxococcaceae bacterium]|nr:MAG: hypothetical protein EOO71_04545 [Myxococcaceae bacterium]
MLTGIQNVADEYQLSKGVQRAQGFPRDAAFQMDPRHAKYVALADSIGNLNRAIVVSRELKEFVEARQPPDVEYLPVSIFNHKKKLASAEYFVINPFRVVDCIDKEKSSYRWNNIDPEKMSSCSRMVLKPETLDERLLMFRPRHVEYHVMVHPELARALEGAGFSGLRFTPIDEFET